MKDILARGLREMGLTPPDGAVERLCRYAELLLEQNQVMNLTAITEPEDVARLHFLDSAAVLAYGRAEPSRPTDGMETARQGCRALQKPRPTESLEPSRPTEGQPTWLAGKSLLDVGTGAGFPGVVLKILEPSLSLTLVDSLGKRIVWLRDVCEVLSLDAVACLHARAEELALEPEFRDSFDVVTSRAVASFPLLCELCLPYVKVGGRFLAMKSVESGGEVQSGANAVKQLGGSLSEPFDYPIPGTDVVHRLVRVEKTAPTPKGYPRSWGKIKKAPL